MARSKDEPGKGGFWRLDSERLEASRRAKRRSTLTVRPPRNRSQKKSKQATPVKPKTKRNRPLPHNRAERKHNILSNISIYSSDDEENNNNNNEEQIVEDSIINVPTSVLSENVIVEPVNQIEIEDEDELSGMFSTSNGCWDDSHLDFLNSFLDSL